MSEYVDFHYMPLEGKITGKQVLKQTEDAINDLGNKVYNLDIDEERIDEAIEKSEQAIDTANSALSAVTTDRAVWKNTVAEMKDTDIDVGVTAVTRGELVFNDGGGAFYGVRSEKSGDVESEDTVFLNNGNVAERIKQMNVIAKGNNIIYVENVSALISADAVIGNVYGTTGYYTRNDGGAGVYSIRAKDVSDVDDGGSIIFLSNGNVAELISDGTVNVKQFGAKGDGVANDAPSFNSAIASGAKYIVIPEPTTAYLLTESVNMTALRGVTFDFQTSTDINAPQILAKHTKAVFDLTSSFDCTFINPNVKGDSATTPTCMFLLARNSTNASAGRHRFFNPRALGYFSTSVIYNYASEENEYYSPCFIQQKAGASCVCITAFNVANLTSEYATIATGAQSTVCNRFYGGSFYSQGNSGSENECVFLLDGASDISIDSAFFYCPYGKTYIESLSDNSSSDIVSITNCRGEYSANKPQYDIFFKGGQTRTFLSWNIVGNRLCADSWFLYGDDSITLYAFHLLNNSNTGSAYGLSAYIVQYSKINFSSLYVETRGNNNNNVWEGVSTSRTLVANTDICLNTDATYNSIRCYKAKTSLVEPDSTFFAPTTDGAILLGASSLRWKEVYAATGTINTSDERLKDNIEHISDEVLDAWGEVGWYQFQFKDALAKKGESARIHCGTIAQRIKEVFESHNLDAFRYGLLCYDEWGANEEHEAGDLYSMRYEEALCMESAYQRRRADRLEARIEALERLISNE